MPRQKNEQKRKSSRQKTLIYPLYSLNITPKDFHFVSIVTTLQEVENDHSKFLKKSLNGNRKSVFLLSWSG